MSEESRPHGPESAPAGRDALDARVDAFEAAWAAGGRPRIEDYRLDPDPSGGRLLVELAHADIEFRCRAGERPEVEEYLAEYPELAASPDVVRELRETVAAALKRRAAARPATRPDRHRSPPGAADLNLLFGVLALQADLVTRDQLVSAITAWASEKSAPLGEILVRQGALDEGGAALLSALVAKHLAKHGGKADASLAAVTSVSPSAREAIARVPDADVQASLLRLPPADTKAESRDGSTLLQATVARAAGRRYRVLRRHARGGLGEVFVARDEEVGREVALKEIQNWAADDPESRARFLLEADITAGLEHPGVVPLYGVGTYADGRPFYAMRFVRGDNLKEAIARYHAPDGQVSPGTERNLALRDLLRRFVDVCETVAYAHSRGVLHRDLKPGNVMLGRYGETLLVDWGLAKVVGRPEPPSRSVGEETIRPSSGSGATPTRAGSVVGTPGYMSPEQAEGRLDLVGVASDVYGLGATLFHILTGRPPFRPDDLPEMLLRIQRGSFPRPRQVDRRVPKPLEAICLKALALRPEDRYATPTALALDVERYLADEPVSSLPEGFSARVARRWRKHRRASLAVLLSLTLIAAFATGSALLIEDARRAEASAAAESRRRLVRADVSRAVQELDALEPSAALPWLAEALRHETDSAESQGPHRIRLALTAAQLPRLERVLGTRGAGAFSEASFAAARWFVTGSSIYDYRTWRPRFEAAPWPPGVDFIAVPFDADLVATLEDGRVTIWDPQTGETRRAEPPERSPPTSQTAADGYLQFSSDGRRLVALIRDPGDLAGGVARPPGVALHAWDASTGRRVASSVFFASDPVRRAADARLKAPDGFRFTVPRPSQLVVAPDGTRVLLVAAAGPFADEPGDRLYRWDLANGSFEPVLAEHLESRPFHVDTEGRQVLRFDAGETATVFDPMSGAETGVVLRGVPADADKAAFDQRGERVLLGGRRTARIYDMRSGEPVAPPTEFFDGVDQIALSPNGRQFAIAQPDGGVRLYDAKTGDAVFPVFRCNGRIRSLAFGPDGSRLLASAAGDAPTTFVWNLRAEEAGYSVRVGPPAETPDFRRSEDGRRILVLGRTLTLVDLGRSGPTVRTLNLPWQVASADLSPDGKSIAASDGARVTIFDADTIRPRQEPFAAGPGRISFGSGGDVVIVESATAIGVWDRNVGRLLRSFQRSPRGPTGERVSPDGRRFVGTPADPSDVVVIDARGGKELPLRTGTATTTPVPRLFASAFSLDGSTIAVCMGTEEVEVHSLEFGQPLALIRHDGGVGHISLSADGTRVATSAGRITRVWDATGAAVSPPLVHPSEVTKAVFPEAPNTLLTVCGSGVRLWHLPTGDARTPWLSTPGGRVADAWLSRDGARLVVAGVSAVRVWEIRGDRRPRADVALHAELVAAAAVDESAGVRRLASDAAVDRFSRLTSLYPESFGIESAAGIEPLRFESARVGYGTERTGN